jgi:hypothetical protein
MNEALPETSPAGFGERNRLGVEDATFWHPMRSELTALRLVVVVLLIQYRESRRVQLRLEPALTQTENRAEHKTHESKINSRRRETVGRSKKERPRIGAALS